MTRGIDGTLTTAVAAPITRPYFLVYMAFSPEVRMSTGASVSWDSYTWLNQDIDIAMSSSPVLRIFNEGTLFGQVVLTGGTAGRAVKIYQGYANDSAHPNPVLIFVGEMGKAVIKDYVTIDCKPIGPKKTPRHYAIPPVCNYIPPPGTRFETPTQIVILEHN